MKLLYSSVVTFSWKALKKQDVLKLFATDKAGIGIVYENRTISRRSKRAQNG